MLVFIFFNLKLNHLQNIIYKKRNPLQNAPAARKKSWALYTSSTAHKSTRPKIKISEKARIDIFFKIQHAQFNRSGAKVRINQRLLRPRGPPDRFSNDFTSIACYYCMLRYYSCFQCTTLCAEYTTWLTAVLWLVFICFFNVGRKFRARTQQCECAFWTNFIIKFF